MPSITNVVVLMLENRSYDNVLGMLPNLPNRVLNGLTGNEAGVTNAVPSQIGGHGQVYAATSMPMIDPQEPFGDMAQQYLGVDPKSATPWAGYTGNAPMDGFVESYTNAPNMTPDNVNDVMTYLSPEQLPVTSFLANQFGVCDNWFASVPTQTFTNRLFALCAAPQVIDGTKWAFNQGGGDPVRVADDYSVVDDADHAVNPLHLSPDSSVADTDSILSQLDLIQPAASGPQWKIYFHDYSIALMTLPYAANAGRASASQNNVSTFDRADWGDVAPMQLTGVPGSTFVDDVQNGTLPPFSLIEPRYNMGLVNIPLIERHPNETLPPSSNHPGAGNITLWSLISKKPPAPDPSNPPIDAIGGELLLMQVYNLLRNSSKYWDSTLLIVTYDEAGGLYDHVPPPTATPISVPAVQSPHQGDGAAENFGFNAFGGRVPAIIISKYVAPGSAITASAAFDHTSIVRTVWDAFDLAQNGRASLTPRDAGAPSLLPKLDFSCTNDAPYFTGQIIASPSRMILDTRGFAPPSRVLLASAGPASPPFTLVASGDSSWFSVTPSDLEFAPDVFGWTININTAALAGISGTTLQGEVVIREKNDRLTPQSVPIFLHVS